MSRELQAKVQSWANNCSVYEYQNRAEGSSRAAEYHRGAKEAFQRVVETLAAAEDTPPARPVVEGASPVCLDCNAAGIRNCSHFDNCDGRWVYKPAEAQVRAAALEALVSFIAAADAEHELLKKSFNHLSREGPTRSNATKATQSYRDARFKFMQSREGLPTLAASEKPQ